MLLQAEDLTRTFPGEDAPVPVLDRVSLAVAAGETVALTGESGSGKSTLLHLLGALDRPDSGKVTVAGHEIGALDDAGRARLRRATIGLVFQQFNLIPSLDAGANLAFQARLAGRDTAAWCTHVEAKLGLAEARHRYPEQLSGGQQQRVAIGRAIAVRPELLLADEPTGNLDEATGDRVLDLMLELVAESGAALVMVTHSDRLASRMRRRLHLSGGRLA